MIENTPAALGVIKDTLRGAWGTPGDPKVPWGCHGPCPAGKAVEAQAVAAVRIVSKVSPCAHAVASVRIVKGAKGLRGVEGRCDLLATLWQPLATLW